MNKKKVCFIAQFPPPLHGLSKAVDTLYNSELKQEFEFEKIDISNNKTIIKNLIKISRSNADLFYFTISQTKYGNLRDLIILKILKMQNKKCLIHLHGGYYRTLVEALKDWQKNANYRAIKNVNGVIVLSPSLRQIFKGMISDNKIYTVPNCVDNQYLMSDAEFQLKVDTIGQRMEKHILYLSNFIRTKGYIEVLKMAKLEKERVEKGKCRKFYFEFAGQFFEDAEQQFFFEYIKNNGLESYITYHGVVSGNQKRDLLLKCDIFMLVTRYPNEGQPISILEAMGNGMVIITTNHAGIPDIVDNEKNGIVLNKDELDMQQCYQKILSISTEKMKEIIQRNRNLIKSVYKQKNYIENMKKIFQIIC